LVANESQMGFTDENTVIASSEKLQGLVQTGMERGTAFPNVPTMSERELPPQINGTFAIYVVRTGTPKVVMDKLYEAASAAMDEPEFRQQMIKLRNTVFDKTQRTGEYQAKDIQSAAAFWGELAPKIGITPQ